MFALHDRPSRLCDGIPRRELIRVGGLSLLGLSLGDLQRRAAAIPAPRGTFGRAKNVIYLWLQGGPPQHETFDPKPDAPAEMRGLFKPISTNVPGIQFCELLPRTAAMADKLAVIRSMSTNDNLHDGSGYWLLTGNKYNGVNSREIRPTDWPYFGSLVKMFKPSESLPPLSTVWIPDVMRLNDNVQPAGQTAGFLGSDWEPERFVCDPAAANFSIEGLRTPAEIPPLRLNGRVGLLDQVQRHFESLERGPASRSYDQLQRDALGLLTSGRAREAFDIRQEPEAVRDRYGRHTWGQTVLLARRLIEAGVRLVHVNWAREPGDTAVNNPMWDTHTQNADRLQDVLCPQFDLGFTALLEDLEQRGLLAETLVVAIGEFGRTPQINRDGGRDHWGPVFSLALAGAGIAGGQVYGASDKAGAYPAADRVEPQELTATIFHLLGIDHQAMFYDRQGRALPISTGEPLYRLLGDAPATTERMVSTGDVNFVPPYDDRLLLDTDFEIAAPFAVAGPNLRTKGWRSAPLWAPEAPDALSVRRVEGPAAWSANGVRHAALGCGLDTGRASGQVATGARLLLMQEVRNPRAGKFTFTARAATVGSSQDYYRDVFQRHFACRLVIFGFTESSKDPSQARVYASQTFQPVFGSPDQPAYQPFTVEVRLRSQDGGAREIEQGVAVAVILEMTAPGPVDLAAIAGWAAIRIDDVSLLFDARPRDENVKV